MTTVTSKGQVTIPKRVRDAAGLKPGAKVCVEYRDGGALITPEARSTRAGKSDFEKRLEKIRGTFNIGGMTTDEYMRMMRGDDD